MKFISRKNVTEIMRTPGSTFSVIVVADTRERTKFAVTSSQEDENWFYSGANKNLSWPLTVWRRDSGLTPIGEAILIHNAALQISLPERNAPKN